jgi:stearoyl-CoA desaturase (delta-9 desaturase)
LAPKSQVEIRSMMKEPSAFVPVAMFKPEVHDIAYFVPDLIRDPVVFRVSRLYFVWVFGGLIIPAVAGGWMTGTWAGALRGFLWGGLVRIALGHHTTWSVNSICHIYGSRPFFSKDRSRNNFWLAIPSFGEAWHNNHHAFPTSAFHGLSWWQIDISGYLIRLLAATGMAWDVKRPLEWNLREAAERPRITKQSEGEL